MLQIRQITISFHFLHYSIPIKPSNVKDIKYLRILYNKNNITKCKIFTYRYRYYNKYYNYLIYVLIIIVHNISECAFNNYLYVSTLFYNVLLRYVKGDNNNTKPNKMIIWSE